MWSKISKKTSWKQKIDLPSNRERSKEKTKPPSANKTSDFSELRALAATMMFLVPSVIPCSFNRKLKIFHKFL